MNDQHPLAELAQRIGRLRPDWQNPERFFESRSEIAAELRRLAREQSPTRNIPQARQFDQWRD
ncbi:MAG TPA: hypothetical protein PK677_10920 [Acidiphilium sp.]|nr:hypothetical protein [Acidiphilium sp.]